MKTEFRASFARDLKSIQSKEVRRHIKEGYPDYRIQGRTRKEVEENLRDILSEQA